MPAVVVAVVVVILAATRARLLRAVAMHLQHVIHVPQRLLLVEHLHPADVLRHQPVEHPLRADATHLRHAVVNQLVEHLLQQHADVIRDAAVADASVAAADCLAVCSPRKADA